MSIKVTDTDVAVILEVHGELDLSTAPMLREKLLEQFAADSARIVVDLTAVPFMDSSALGVLVGAQRRAAAQEGWLRLAGPHQQLRRVLATTGLDQVMFVFDTVDAALQEPPGS